MAEAAVRASKDLKRLQPPGDRNDLQGCAGTIGDVLVLKAPNGRILRGGVKLQAPFPVSA